MHEEIPEEHLSQGDLIIDKEKREVSIWAKGVKIKLHLVHTLEELGKSLSDPKCRAISWGSSKSEVSSYPFS